MKLLNHLQQTVDLDVENPEVIERVLSDHDLMALPAVVDPHVHFRTPGHPQKEDWQSGAKLALRGGCTTVFDMPNTLPPTITRTLLNEKKALIDSQLRSVNIPLNYRLYFGADKNHLDEIPNIQSACIGIKVFMGCSTGNLVIDDDDSLNRVFAMAAQHNMLVAVHAEDEGMIQTRRQTYPITDPNNYRQHSFLRNESVAATAVAKAINMAQHHGTTLYILHVSSKEEIDLIRAGKLDGVHVYAETTPHHLFFNTDDYFSLQGRVQVNPPLRDKNQQSHLFTAIHEGVIDTIGSDHAPHTISEKSLPFGQCPSGMPGLEFLLPSLLNACNEGELHLEEIIRLTSTNARSLFNLPANNDWVLVDINHMRTIEGGDTLSRCGYTPYVNRRLKGWPMVTILNGLAYDLSHYNQ